MSSPAPIDHPSPIAPSALKPGVPLWCATVIACLSSFMVVMDGAIVNVALPSMTNDLGLAVQTQQWVVNAYLIALGGFMLLSARLGDLYGRRRVLHIGLILFTGASLIGGFAESGAFLLGARAVQGLGASVLATSTLAIIVSAYPKGKARDQAIGLWTGTGAMAAAFGVLAGGLLTAYAGWRWVMFINVPFGLLLMVLTSYSLPSQKNKDETMTFDLAGAVTVTGAMVCLVYALAETMVQGWQAQQVTGLLGAALGFMALFLAIETGAKQPLVRLGIFRLRNVVIGNVMLLCLGATLTSSLYFLSIALHEIAGYGPQDTGLAMLPACLSIAVSSIGARSLRDRGIPHLPLFGGLLAALGLFWLAALPSHVDFLRDVVGPTLLLGCGIGLMLATSVHAAIAGIPPADTGLASGLLNTMRQLGGALGIALIVTLVHSVTQSQTILGLSGPLAALSGYHAAFVATGIISALTGLSSLALRQETQ